MSQLNNSRSFRERLSDFYLEWPLFGDAVLSGTLVLILHAGAKYIPLDASSPETVLNSLAGTAISLAGFILTGLTIIVSIRANLTAKGLKDAYSGVELLFNSSHYEKVVRVFKQAIQGLVIGAILSYGTIFFTERITERHALLIGVVVLVEIAAAVWRCLFVLFAIIQLEVKYRKMQDPD
jgi:uncharacterized membrane protein